ncbi:MAG: alpha/beta hydrolase [Brooklawnia sp.]|uniref:alpha/beta fold hydrolase n=1 Tax=Brooklawnia sp. TaxID=2699740 RepID=UPI003C71B8C0
MDTMTASDPGVPMGDSRLLHEVTGTGDPIVLVPGILTGWASWKDHAERLAHRHTVVRVQPRSVELAEAGEPIPPDYSIGMERDALLATVDALGLERFDLAGWSLGGGVGLAFALEYPERVRTLTLIEPEAPWVLRATGHAAEALAAATAFDHDFARRETITIEDLKNFLVRAGIGDPDTDFESHPRWPLMAQNRQALSTIGAISSFTDSLDRLRALDVPILAVRGTDSTETDIAITEDIVAMAPDARLLKLPGDHSCFLQHPDQFLTALEKHIAAAAGGG